MPLDHLLFGLQALQVGLGHFGILHLDDQRLDLHFFHGPGIGITHHAVFIDTFLPVARVTRVSRSTTNPYLRIDCVPLAGIERDRIVRVLLPVVAEEKP